MDKTYSTAKIASIKKSDNVKRMQKTTFQILKYFASFCEEHKLRYFLACGTLLGAVRHKGFIPWDDDVDVYMPRKDYMSFLHLVGSSFDSRYILISPYNSERYIHNYAKIYDSQTVLIEYPDTIRFEIGVYIDIFPVDGLPDSSKESNRFFKEMAKLKNINWLLISKCEMFKLSPKLHKRLYGYFISFLDQNHRQEILFQEVGQKSKKI